MKTLTQINRTTRVVRNVPWPVNPAEYPLPGPYVYTGLHARIKVAERAMSRKMAHHLYADSDPNSYKRHNRREVLNIVLNLAYVAAAAGALGGFIVGVAEWIDRYWPLP